MAKKKYIVIVDQPEDVTWREMAAYIEEAVEVWGGQKYPDDPLFTGNWNNDVTVRKGAEYE